MQWAPDGRAFYSVSLTSGRKHLLKIAVPSGQTREIYRDLNGGLIFGIAVSPDGQSLAVNVSDGAEVKLDLVSATDGSTRELMRRAVADPGHYRLQQWTRDGRNILLTRRVEKPTVTEELWSVPAAGGPPRSLNLAREVVDYVRVSPDGERIVFRTGRPYWDLWLMDNILNRRPADRQ